MAYEIRLAKRLVKDLKKIKDRQLKQKFVQAIYDEIAVNPFAGSAKRGDLRGYYVQGFRYSGTEYRIAYLVQEDEQVVIIVLAGSHENFYRQLRRRN